MTTRDEIVKRLSIRRVRKHYLPNLTRPMVRQAAQQLTDQEWDKIIAALRNGNARIAGECLEDRIMSFLEEKARLDVEESLGQDDTLTIGEIIDLI